ncbi:hypothetical protein [Paenarthrobacter ilicis]|uniref:hypothetical protein n=1 Tax=Paenarthrobacter ilicis TaxID=43665 RepID=UPI0038653662
MATTLAQYVKAVDADSAFVASCAAEALALVTAEIGKVTTVPAEIKARAVLEVGAELFHRRQSRNGIAGLDNTDATPMRIARDPMKAAYPLLNPFLGPGIG